MILNLVERTNIFTWKFSLNMIYLKQILIYFSQIQPNYEINLSDSQVRINETKPLPDTKSRENPSLGQMTPRRLSNGIYSSTLQHIPLHIHTILYYTLPHTNTFYILTKCCCYFGRC